MFCENTFPGKEQTDNIHDKNEIWSTYFSVNVEVGGGGGVRENSDTSDCIFTRLVLMQNHFDCVIRPEVTLCGWRDVKTQSFTQCVGYVPTPLWQLDVKQVKWHPHVPSLPSKKMLQINMGRDGEIYTQYD